MAEKGKAIGSAAGTAMQLVPAEKETLRSRIFCWSTLRGYLFISPWIIGFIVFTAGPLLASILISLTEWDVLGPMRWVGPKNYIKIFTRDPKFTKTLFNTAYYVAFHVPGMQLVALSLALLLNQELRGIAIYRTIFYLPSVTSGVATSILWMTLFAGETGLINVNLQRFFGIKGPVWLFSLRWSMPALIIMSLWGGGRAMIIYLAGLQGIPNHLYEAAEIDGGGSWAKFWNVTIPMLTPAIFFNIVMSIIGSFQVFTSAYVMTGGGPITATLFYVLYLYRTAFESFAMGYATALAWMLFIIILFFTMVQIVLSRRWVYYEGTRGGVL